jgi:hypothetical protein
MLPIAKDKHSDRRATDIKTEDRKGFTDGVLDWMIEFIGTLYTPLVTIGNYSAIAILHT